MTSKLDFCTTFPNSCLFCQQLALGMGMDITMTDRPKREGEQRATKNKRLQVIVSDGKLRLSSNFTTWCFLWSSMSISICWKCYFRTSALSDRCFFWELRRNLERRHKRWVLWFAGNGFLCLSLVYSCLQRFGQLDVNRSWCLRCFSLKQMSRNVKKASWGAQDKRVHWQESNKSSL